MVLTAVELAAEDDSNLINNFTLTCLPNATWDQEITDYACTPACPIPLFDSKVMEHFWPDPTTTPQYSQNVV